VDEFDTFGVIKPMECCRYSGRPLMYNTNKRDPSILPCGTPDRTGRKSEFLLLMLTHCMTAIEQVSLEPI